MPARLAEPRPPRCEPRVAESSSIAPWCPVVAAPRRLRNAGREPSTVRRLDVPRGQSKAHATRSAVSVGFAAGRLTGTPGTPKAHVDHSHLRRPRTHESRRPHQRERPQPRPPSPREPPQPQPPSPRERQRDSLARRSSRGSRRSGDRPNHGSRRSGDRSNHAAPRVTTRAGARRVRPAPCTAGCSRAGAPAGRCGGGAVRRRTCPARRGAGRGAPWHRPRTCRAWRRART